MSTAATTLSSVDKTIVSRPGSNRSGEASRRAVSKLRRSSNVQVGSNENWEAEILTRHVAAKKRLVVSALAVTVATAIAIHFTMSLAMVGGVGARRVCADGGNVRSGEQIQRDRHRERGRWLLEIGLSGVAGVPGHSVGRPFSDRSDDRIGKHVQRCRLRVGNFHHRHDPAGDVQPALRHACNRTSLSRLRSHCVCRKIRAWSLWRSALSCWRRSCSFIIWHA